MPLSDQAQDLLHFAWGIHRTPENVIGIGIGHEMFGWDDDQIGIHQQHFPNRFVDWARSNCGGQLTRNCMLNFFMKEYQSVQNLVYDSTPYGRTHRIHSKYWRQPDPFTNDQDVPNWDQKYINAGMNVMDNFWSNINPNFNPADNPQDRDSPYDTGVYNASDLRKVLNGPPGVGTGILALKAAPCSDGSMGYSVVVSWTGYVNLSSLKVC